MYIYSARNGRQDFKKWRASLKVSPIRQEFISLLVRDSLQAWSGSVNPGARTIMQIRAAFGFGTLVRFRTSTPE